MPIPQSKDKSNPYVGHVIVKSYRRNATNQPRPSNLQTLQSESSDSEEDDLNSSRQIITDSSEAWDAVKKFTNETAKIKKEAEKLIKKIKALPDGAAKKSKLQKKLTEVLERLSELKTDRTEITVDAAEEMPLTEEHWQLMEVEKLYKQAAEQASKYMEDYPESDEDETLHPAAKEMGAKSNKEWRCYLDAIFEVMPSLMQSVLKAPKLEKRIGIDTEFGISNHWHCDKWFEDDVPFSCFNCNFEGTTLTPREGKEELNAHHLPRPCQQCKLEEVDPIRIYCCWDCQIEHWESRHKADHLRWNVRNKTEKLNLD